MKKLLLLTWYDNNNYGTSLQAFALKTILEEPSCTGLIEKSVSNEMKKCIILRHRPERQKSVWNKVRKVVSPKAYIQKIEQYKDRKIRIARADKFKERENAFVRFNGNNFSFSGSKDIQSTEELSELAENYDVFISGSDQIWNPEALDSTYLLEWVPENKKIISYGSSSILI